MTTQPIKRPPPMNGSNDWNERLSSAAGMAYRMITAMQKSANRLSRTAFERLITPKKNTTVIKKRTAGWANTWLTVRCCIVSIKLLVSNGRRVSVAFSISFCFSMDRLLKGTDLVLNTKIDWRLRQENKLEKQT